MGVFYSLELLLITQYTGEVAALRQAEYFGDGFWSAGQVLKDGAQEGRREEDEEDAPEYLVSLSPRDS